MRMLSVTAAVGVNASAGTAKPACAGSDQAASAAFGFPAERFSATAKRESAFANSIMSRWMARSARPATRRAEPFLRAGPAPTPPRPARAFRLLRLLLISLCCALIGCAAETPVTASPPQSTPTTTSELFREVRFPAADGTILAGELALPPDQPPRALIVIIHHSGPVDRTSYAYLRDLLVLEGHAVFTFDKRGNGASAGVYGCCEAEDALAAYSAAIDAFERPHLPVIIVAQSIGTRYMAEQFPAIHGITPPAAVALLSSLLGPDAITAVAAPVIVIVADSEPELERIGPHAVAAHQAALPYGAELYVADNAEHTLFDISAGPIDWDDPSWAERYHRGAMHRLIIWLDAHAPASPAQQDPTPALFLPMLARRP
jgi:uncharacterized protein